MSPNQPEYKDVEARIVRYDFDPRRASQIIEALGYSKGSDGLFRDAANQKLSIDFRTVEGFDVHHKTLFPIADAWQRTGVGVDAFVIPRVQVVNPQYRATFPGLELLRNPNHMSRLLIYRSSQLRLPENNYLGSNYMNYQNDEWDTLLDRYFSTVPTRARNAVLADVMHHMTDRVIALPIIYDVESFLIAHRVENMTPRNSNVRAPQGWNAHLWDIKG